jgi:hypothetical protein
MGITRSPCLLQEREREAGRGGTPVVLAAQEAEAGGLLEFRSSGLQCALPIGVHTMFSVSVVTSREWGITRLPKEG